MKNFDVDIVITWVDGSDKEWIKEKNKYLPVEKRTDIDAAANRFRDWDNVKYIFRGIEKFAPWVRKVFFVTCGQTPSWMNTKNEKLVLVNHKDYMPEEYLPTFSSHPIELNMHRIKGLSEHFIFMCDDFFFTKDTKVTDFFDKDGLPKIVAVEKPITVHDRVYLNIVWNNIRTINSKFNKIEIKSKNKLKWYSPFRPKETLANILFNHIGKNDWNGIYYDHLPSPFLKSSIESCWADFGEILDETSKHKFRSIDDVSQVLFSQYQLCTGKFSPDKIGKKGKLLNIDDKDNKNVEDACNLIMSQKHNTICINDDLVNNFEATRDKINAALDKILPEKSSFEI